MFSSSIDILYLVLAICIAALTFFLCWAIYYFVAGIQRINRITKRIEDGVVRAEELIFLAQNKLKNSSAYFMILSEIAKKAMEFIKERRSASKEKATKNRKK